MSPFGGCFESGRLYALTVERHEWLVTSSELDSLLFMVVGAANRPHLQRIALKNRLSDDVGNNTNQRAISNSNSAGIANHCRG